MQVRHLHRRAALGEWRRVAAVQVLGDEYCCDEFAATAVKAMELVVQAVTRVFVPTSNKAILEATARKAGRLSVPATR